MVSPVHGNSSDGIARRKPTKLERFLKSRGIKPVHLALESGYTRQHLLRIRFGRMDPTLGCIVAIVRGCRVLSGEQVTALDLFNLDPEDVPLKVEEESRQSRRRQAQS